MVITLHYQCVPEVSYAVLCAFTIYYTTRIVHYVVCTSNSDDPLFAGTRLFVIQC